MSHCDNVMTCNIVSNLTHFSTYPSPLSVNRVEPCYNDIGLCDTLSIASDILRYKLIPHYLYLVDRALFFTSFYFFTNLIHLVFYNPWLFVSLSLHVSEQSVHHQEDEMLNYTSSFWRRSVGH